ncbi:hypothetical protein D3C72_1816790 [compost metagenome]
MLDHVGQRLLHDAQHVQRGGGVQPGQRRQVVHVPVQGNAALRQAVAHALAQSGQQGGQVLVDGLHRINGQAQVFQAFAQHLGHLALRQAALLDLAQR